MKSVTFSTAAIFVVAGTAFAAKNAEVPVLEAAAGFTAPTGGERAGADALVVDVTGIQSRDLIGSPFNTVLFFNVGVGNTITGLGWDVVLTAFSPSWRSEITVVMSDSSGGQAIFLRPGAANSSPGGPTAYSSNGIIKFDAVALPNIFLADGLLRLEFGETYEDFPGGGADGVWNSGTLTFQTLNVIPAPGAAGLLGLAGVALLGRKRR